MSLLKRIEKGLLSTLLLVSAGSAPADVVVVVSPSSPVSTLRSSQIKDIFLGKSGRFPNGERAVPVDQAEGSATRNEFYLSCAGRSASQIKAHWSKLIFTGRGYPPREVTRPQEIKKIVSEDAHLIGYLDRSAVDGKVKVVSIIDD